jgi:hypothetical protein
VLDSARFLKENEEAPEASMACQDILCLAFFWQGKANRFLFMNQDGKKKIQTLF